MSKDKKESAPKAKKESAPPPPPAEDDEVKDKAEEEVPKDIGKPGITFETENGTKTLVYEDFYEQKDRLASGSFGTVYVAEHKGTKTEYAVKVVDRSRLSEKDHDLVNREVGILKDCRSIHSIVRLIDYFESPTHYYVVQIYARGGKWFFSEFTAEVFAKVELIEDSLSHHDLQYCVIFDKYFR